MAAVSYTAKEKRAVYSALQIVESKLKAVTNALNYPEAVAAYLRLKMAGLKREEFHVIWLNSQNRVIRCKRLFVGTVTETVVYPREVVRDALRANAAGATS